MLLSLAPHGEPMLGPRGLYHAAGSSAHDPSAGARVDAIVWLLNQSNGHNTLADISARSHEPYDTLLHKCPNEGFRFFAVGVELLSRVAKECEENELLRRLC